MFANKDAFDKLPADQKTALTGRRPRTAERGAGRHPRSRPPSKRKVLADNKIAVVQPTPALKKALQEARRHHGQRMEASAGADGKAILEAYRK